MATLTKLDTYDYVLLPGVIQVTLSGTNDPILVDIYSELEKSNGYIYVEGNYYLCQGTEIITNQDRTNTYLEIQVVLTQ